MITVPHIGISDREYQIHRCPRSLRRWRRLDYPVNLHSGKPITEFVALADHGVALGLPVIPQSQTEDFLRRGIPVLKFGATDHAADLALLSRYPGVPGEWNRRNLDKVTAYNRYLDLDRQTWNLYLSAAEHQVKLAELFRDYGPLFIKSLTKGHAHVYASFDECMAAFGNVARLTEDTADVLVSEVMNILRIDAATPDGPRLVPDEWRHYIYRQELIATTHAFDCDESRTDDTGRQANIQKAETILRQQRDTGFATSYVLDTCMLTDGSVAVIETNNFFASGIYTTQAIRAIAEAIHRGQHA